MLKVIYGYEEDSQLLHSLALNSAERIYSRYEGELLAVEKACHEFRVFFFGQHLTFRKDQKALAEIFTSAMGV